MRMSDTERDTVNWATVQTVINTFGKQFVNTDMKNLKNVHSDPL